MSGSKATLASQDVRFAKTIARIQKIVIAELNKIAIIHLFLLGFKGEDLVDFELKLAGSSTIAEQQKLELIRMRAEIAATIQEGTFDREWVQKNIYKLSDEEILQVSDGKVRDKLEDLSLENVQLPPEAQPGGSTADAVPGEEQLPQTLGGEPQEAPASPERPAEEPVEPETATESIEIDELRNKGSEGNRAEVSTDKGKDLFSTGEDQHALVFGTKRKSDPSDRRALKRFITRPFSESMPILKKHRGTLKEQVDVVDERLSEAIEKTVVIDEEFTKELEKLSKGNFNKNFEDDDFE